MMKHVVPPEPPPFGAHSARGFAGWAIARTRSSGESWLSRRMAYLLRRLALLSLRNRPVDIEAFGARMRIHPQSNVCEKRVLFMPQFFDTEEREALEADIARAGEGARYHFVDVGANVGPYALFVAARAGRGARILAIEPQPFVFGKLAFNIGLNPFGTVKAVACAVADRAGELTLFLDPRNEGASSVRMLRTSPEQSVQAPAMPLLDLLVTEGFTHVDAMKIDVEGAEDLVLEPFLASAKRELWPRLLIVDDASSTWSVDLAMLLEKSGYRLLRRTRLNLIFRLDALS